MSGHEIFAARIARIDAKNNQDIAMPQGKTSTAAKRSAKPASGGFFRRLFFATLGATLVSGGAVAAYVLYAPI